MNDNSTQEGSDIPNSHTVENGLVVEAFRNAEYIRFFDKDGITIGYCTKKGYQFIIDHALAVSSEESQYAMWQEVLFIAPMAFTQVKGLMKRFTITRKP